MRKIRGPRGTFSFWSPGSVNRTAGWEGQKAAGVSPLGPGCLASPLQPGPGHQRIEGCNSGQPGHPGFRRQRQERSEWETRRTHGCSDGLGGRPRGVGRGGEPHRPEDHPSLPRCWPGNLSATSPTIPDRGEGPGEGMRLRPGPLSNFLQMGTEPREGLFVFPAVGEWGEGGTPQPRPAGRREREQTRSPPPHRHTPI